MSEIKYSSDYIKAMCTMIARGDITDIITLKKYLQYVDLDTMVKANYHELEMLFGINLKNFNPKYYELHNTYEKKYAPIDLILYSSISNKPNSLYRRELLYSTELFEEIIKIDSIDFSNICTTLSYAVSNGDLELFKLLISLNPDFNIKHSALKNGEPISILDECLSTAICKLTVSGESVARLYPKEIFNTLVSIENIDFSLLKSTKVILEVLLNVENIDIDNKPNIIKKAIEAVEEKNWQNR